jgi:phosphoenolpyruvate-protein phosphotransferase
MDRARQETERLSHRIAALVGDEGGTIMQAQMLILQDNQIQSDLDAFLAQGTSAEAAVLHTAEKYTRAFEQLSSDYFRERIYDIRDVFRRVLWHLRPGTAAPETQDQRLVLVGDEASVAELFSVDLERLAAVVVERGGRNSHAAILARTLRIPMVSQVANLASTVRTGTPLLVDGDRALVYVEPSAELMAEYESKPAASVSVRVAEPNGLGAEDATPAEKKRPAVQANVNFVSEVPEVVRHGADGVGLYRTEFLVLSRRTMISEEQQVANYWRLLESLGGLAASIRTFDLRAEKSLPPSADQPDPGSLDWRLVLRSPAVQRVFKQQVRAILRAGVAGPARILVPLVVSSEQLVWVKSTIDEARDELHAEGLKFASDVPLGIMIEVPVSAQMVDEWAGQVDFICVGTNDLLASAMGVSRDDPVSEIVCDPLHPALLRTVERVIQAAHSAGKAVTVCGELAATDQGVDLLADMEVDVLSVAVDQLVGVRNALRNRAAGGTVGDP